MKNKAEIRASIIAQRRKIAKKWHTENSQKITEKIQSLTAFKDSKTIAIYMAISGEVAMDPLFSICMQMNKRTCIPVFNMNKKKYEMAEITEKTIFHNGHFNIPEPSSPIPASLTEIDLMITPGVAFDIHGNRLGRGGGYYDQLLKKFNGLKVGVGFEFQILPEIPIEDHDQAVDCVLTELNCFSDHYAFKS